MIYDAQANCLGYVPSTSCWFVCRVERSCYLKLRELVTWLTEATALLYFQRGGSEFKCRHTSEIGSFRDPPSMLLVLLALGFFRPISMHTRFIFSRLYLRSPNLAGFFSRNVRFGDGCGLPSFAREYSHNRHTRLNVTFYNYVRAPGAQIYNKISRFKSIVVYSILKDIFVKKYSALCHKNLNNFVRNT
jgi:hypothetical protein